LGAVIDVQVDLMNNGVSDKLNPLNT
jgi:hypothetical protein